MIILGWIVRHYRWCFNCTERVANPGSDLCPLCAANLTIGLMDLLEENHG